MQPQTQIKLIQSDQNQKWIPYHQSHSEQTSILQIYHNQIKNLCKLIIIVFTIYLIVSIISPLTLIIIGLGLAAVGKLILLKIKELRKQGLANILSPKLKQILFQKSIFDIYSDMLYFPIVQKIILAFVKPIIQKPHPDNLPESFINLPQNIQRNLTQKGLLSLTPQPIRQLFISKDHSDHSYNLPQHYSKSSWQWHNYEKYENHHEKIHEQTLVKNFIDRIDNKVTWPKFLIFSSLVTFGVFSMKTKRMKKMLIQNGSFIGIIIIFFIIMIKIKVQKQKIIKRKELSKIENQTLMLLDKQQQ